ncbi:transposable element Tcb2 transposase [Trichonephila clavipes]|nr:transposable element Tcb2 transposase [Trichonephila clavipes]
MIFYVVELLNDWNVDLPIWKYPRNLESPRVSSPGFGNDSKMKGNVSRCYSTCRPQVTTLNEGRYLAVTAKRNRRSTASDLSHQLSSATGTTVSRQTVYRRLGHIGLYARRFSLQCDSRRTLIWRAPGTRYHQENTIERHRYGGEGWLA